MADVTSCGFLIYRRDPKPSFLLMRHPDRWDLPKGHVDPGETEIQCALRELHEETGIREADIKIDPGFQYESEYVVRYKRNGNRPQSKRLVILLAELVSEVDIRLTEHEGSEWIPWNPPHRIQELTIDPLLAFLEEHWASNDST